MASFFDNKARAANAAASSSSKPKQNSATAERAQPWVEKYRSVLGLQTDELA
jgi:replication factor C subunit 2/4